METAVPEVLSFSARMLVAVVLIRSATAKMRAPASFSTVLSRLGITWVRPIRVLVVAAEVSVAVGMVLPVPGLIPAIGVVSLGVIFAGAGTLALLFHREPIVCACFGENSGHALGWRQLVALPVWIGTAVLVLAHEPGTSEAAIIGTGIVVMAGLSYALPLLSATASARRDRKVMDQILWGAR